MSGVQYQKERMRKLQITLTQGKSKGVIAMKYKMQHVCMLNGGEDHVYLKG